MAQAVAVSGLLTIPLRSTRGSIAMLRKLLLATAIVIATTAVHAAEIPGSRYSAGNWIGGAYADDRTGQFSHCAASTTYVSGHIVIFAINGEGGFTMSIAHRVWRLPYGTYYPIGASVDGVPFSPGTAEVVAIDQVRIRLIANDATYRALKQG